jgi:4-alpha-glucanotransferase
MGRTPWNDLIELARLHGVQTDYLDMSRRRRPARPESLLAVLRALGAPVQHPRDVRDALREARRARIRQAVEPIHVAWQGQPAAISFRLPACRTADTVRLELRLENGERRRRELTLQRLPVNSRVRADGQSFLTRSLPVPGSLPTGYHRAVLECGADRFETWLFGAPGCCFAPRSGMRKWGVFAPLYALHSERSRGAGDFGDLEAFIAWVATRGGRFVGTLPLLPAFLDHPCEPSPYSPVSRLWWNEFYLDLDRVPELADCPKARRLMESPEFLARRERLRRQPLVSYSRQMQWHRQVLEHLSRFFFSRPSARRRRFDAFLRRHPLAEDYARFRAVQEQRGEPWRRWPDRLRAGDLRDRDCPAPARDYHLYVQWLAHEQMDAVSKAAAKYRVDLYLDLPLGTHRDGYDTWRYRTAFALEASGGAPPDPVFIRGQNWGFAPLHPERSRAQGHAYFAAVLRHHLQHASMLRIDHVMGLHRLYWVPQDMPADLGAYVRYPADEIYAVLCIESQRHRAVVVGENLGTVPPEVNRRLDRHAVAGMYVVQYEVAPPPKPVLRRAPARAVAGLNTHDMPPFEAWRRGLDLADRRELGLIRRTLLARESRARAGILRRLAKLLRRRGRLQRRSNEPGALLHAVLEHLAAGPARWLLVNLEDLWLETLPQNVPGTSTERINWRRKLRLSRESLQHDPAVVELLHRVDQLRRG